MKRTLSNKRVARKIGGDDEEENEASSGSSQQGKVFDNACFAHNSNPTSRRRLMNEVGSVVKRPPVVSKVKKSSKLRMSFGPGEGEDGDSTATVTPKKSLGRQAIERTAGRISSEQLEFRVGSEDRPRYSKDFLSELRQATPTTPKDVSTSVTTEEEELEKSLDVVSKFGSETVNRENRSSIPTEAEIKEKKERRARLAQAGQEKEFISLDASDSEEEQRKRELYLNPKQKYPESRLVREDEDIAEGFDDYVEDGGLSLGRKAQREEKQRKKKEMQDLIAEAEAVDLDAESDDSEAERIEAFEAAQTRAGTYAQHRNGDEATQPKAPAIITPIPELSTVLEKMRANLKKMQESKTEKERKLEELDREKMEIKEKEVWIQKQLREVGERYEKLRAEAGTAGATDEVQERGLESFGATPRTGTPLGWNKDSEAG